MTKNSTSSTNSKWTGMVPVDDTALAVTDTGGPGIPVVYLNGQFATQGYWRRVIAELGTGWRHITYDERARGKSKRSADYSFEVAVRDVDAVLAAGGTGAAGGLVLRRVRRGALGRPESGPYRGRGPG
ncbi:alpha/beta fold hydrolase [Streptomyces lunaelactis]|uniref:alpha/beta fold hydrolase n=1 Tax=Streptomyces lunaelactis TaxID=1535768 RepID=UPI0020C81090|nr:alpha/beta hydrolase [Streptomyces lunaelactis]